MGLNPADCGGEVVILLKDAKATFTVDIEAAARDRFIINSQFRDMLINGFRSEENLKDISEGISPMEKEIPTFKNLPYGKLYSRKLRIRR